MRRGGRQKAVVETGPDLEHGDAEGGEPARAYLEPLAGPRPAPAISSALGCARSAGGLPSLRTGREWVESTSTSALRSPRAHPEQGVELGVAPPRGGAAARLDRLRREHAFASWRARSLGVRQVRVDVPPRHPVEEAELVAGFRTWSSARCRPAPARSSAPSRSGLGRRRFAIDRARSCRSAPASDQPVAMVVHLTAGSGSSVSPTSWSGRQQAGPLAVHPPSDHPHLGRIGSSSPGGW